MFCLLACGLLSLLTFSAVYYLFQNTLFLLTLNIYISHWVGDRSRVCCDVLISDISTQFTMLLLLLLFCVVNMRAGVSVLYCFSVFLSFCVFLSIMCI